MWARGFADEAINYQGGIFKLVAPRFGKVFLRGKCLFQFPKYLFFWKKYINRRGEYVFLREIYVFLSSIYIFPRGE